MPTYDDQRPQTLPDDDELRRLTGIDKPHEQAIDRRAAAAAKGTPAQGAAAPNAQGGQGAAETASGGFVPGGIGQDFLKNSNPKQALGGRVKNFFWGSAARKAGTLGGGTTGLLAIILLLMGIISTGPLTVLIASHDLKQEFSRSNHESSSRLNKLFRYARATDNGETHVGRVGSKVFGRAIQQLKDIGVEFDRNRFTGRPASMKVDTQKLADSVPELKNAGPEEIKSYLSDKLGIPAESIADAGGGKLTLGLKGMSISSLRLLTRSTLGLLDNGSIATAIKVRVLTKFFDLPSLFHPFSRARAAAEQALADKIAARKEKQGESRDQAAREANAEAAAQEEAKNFATSVEEPFTGEAQTAADKITEEENGVAGKLGKALTLTGYACIAYNTAGDIAKANRYAVILPAAAAAMRIVSAGENIKAGKIGTGGITEEQVGALVNSFTDKNGHSIFGGQAMQSLDHPAGPLTGTDLPLSYKQAFSGKSSMSRIQGDAGNTVQTIVPFLPVSTTCSTPGQLAQGGILVGLSLASVIATAGTDLPAVVAAWSLKTVAQGVVSMVALRAVLSVIMKVAINSPLPEKMFSGPVGGDLLAYGARAGSNIASVASGGIALTGTSTSTLIYAPHAAPAMSLATRLFSTTDENSLFAHIAMPVLMNGWHADIAGAVSSLLNLSGSLSHVFSSMVSHAYAATPTASGASYNWGFPQYGIPDDLLNDPTLADPYANADAVASVLDKTCLNSDGSVNTSCNYISKASTCFGVNITKGVDGTWGVTPGNMVDTLGAPYEDGGCNESGSGGISVDTATWHRLIMFIFDTRTMDAAACFGGVDQSCYTQSASNTSGSSGQSGGFVWPFATKSTSQYQRVDRGWDIQGTPGAAVYAIADGTLDPGGQKVYAPDPGGFGNDYPVEKLDAAMPDPPGSPAGSGDWVYYGHVHVIPSLIGQHVSAGQVIAYTNTTYGQNGSGAPAGWLEIGFAIPNTDAPAIKGTEGSATAAGQAMHDILINAQPAQSATGAGQ